VATWAQAMGTIGSRLPRVTSTGTVTRGSLRSIGSRRAWSSLRSLTPQAPAGTSHRPAAVHQDPGKLGELASTTHSERPHLPSGPRRPTCQDWNTARTQPSRLFLNRSYPRGPLIQRHRMGGQVGRLKFAACHPLQQHRLGPRAAAGHEVPITRRVPGAATRHQAAGYCSQTGREPYSERRPTAPVNVSPKGSRATRQSLRCTTRVTRCRTRLICQRHRGSTRPGPRPRPASSGAPARRAVCWLIHCLVDASRRGADAPAWSAL
jgi:hypothetical protein